MADEIVASDGIPKAGRNKRLFDAVLDGVSFKEAGKAFCVGQSQARAIFFRLVRKAGHQVWNDAIRETGAELWPPLEWLRANKDLVVTAIESGVEEVGYEYLAARKVSLGLLREIQLQRGRVEALKAAMDADKAGFEAMIRELRDEVLSLKGRQCKHASPPDNTNDSKP